MKQRFNCKANKTYHWVLYLYLLVHEILFSDSIAGYNIEKRKKGGDWEKCNDYPVQGTRCAVNDLVEGTIIS